jgi:hypothetical protein
MLSTRGIIRLAFAATAVALPATLASAAGTSPFSTAVQALPGLDLYSQFDAADVDTNVAGIGCCQGYVNSVGGGWMIVAGGGAFAPGASASGPGAPLFGVVGDVNLSQQNRPGSGPDPAAVGTVYTSLGFRGQPNTGSATAFYGGAWVHTNGLDRSTDQVIMGQDQTAGVGTGTGLDNNSPQGSTGSWHLFSRDDDGAAGGSGKLSWQMGDGTNLVNFESAINVNDTGYTFVAFSYNGNPADPSALTLYVDGLIAPTTRTVAGSDAALSFAVGAHTFAIGNSFGHTDIWDGPIDEAFFGFGALSAPDARDLYNASLPEPTSLALLALGAAAVVRRRSA